MTEMSEDEISELIEQWRNMPNEGRATEQLVEISFKAGQNVKASELLDGIPAAIAQARKNGIREALVSYAWWKDGVQYVGTTGSTLKEALKDWGVE